MINAFQFVQGPSNLSMPAATVIPVLHYADVPAAAAWLRHAFGFAERLRIANHRAQLDVGAGAVVLAEGFAGPASLGAAVNLVMVRVADVDRHCDHARAAGATILNEPVSQPYGERQYSAADLGGHIWTFSQTEADIDPARWGGTLIAGTASAGRPVP